jgi:hypothetical protein
MPSRKRKILLIGSIGFNASNESASVSCVPWEKIGSSPNLRDYDAVVLNLLGLDAERRDLVDWSAFSSVVSFPVARDVLQNHGKIIVLGDPRFTIKLSSKKEGEDTELPFLFWSGLECTWDNSNGDTVLFHDTYDHKDYADYVKRLNRWDYSLDGVSIDPNTVRRFFRTDYLNQKGLEVARKVETIVENRYRNLIVCEVRIGVFKDTRYERSDNLIFGPILFLPPISASEDETVQIVLRDLCGFDAALPEPTWIKDFTAPGQKQVDEEIVRLNGEAEVLRQRLKQAFADREKRRECLKLLYEREFGLEPAVRDILRALGAHVEDPKEENKEDGWITVVVGKETHEGVLEIKSTRSDSFTEDGRKQLLDWVDRGRTQRAKQYKGIFIGNSAVNKPATERQYPFSDSWKKSAELSGICAMTSTDLYVVYLLKSRNLLDVDLFWRELFSTNGIFDARKYYEALAPKEKS